MKNFMLVFTLVLTLSACASMTNEEMPSLVTVADASETEGSLAPLLFTITLCGKPAYLILVKPPIYKILSYQELKKSQELQDYIVQLLEREDTVLERVDIGGCI